MSNFGNYVAHCDFYILGNTLRIDAGFSALQSLDMFYSSERATSWTGYHGYHADKAAVKRRLVRTQSLSKHCLLPSPREYV